MSSVSEDIGKGIVGTGGRPHRGTDRSIEIGPYTFKNKGAIATHCQEILAAGMITPEDQEFLRDLLTRHREAGQKIGVGVSSFEVGVAPGFHRQRCFWLTRIDGSRTDFSYRSCLTAPPHRQQVVEAFRFEVKDQTSAFKKRVFLEHPTPICGITGEPLDHDDAHVDHVVPFIELIEQFLSSLGLTIDRVKVIPTRDGVTHEALADRKLAKEWREYHKDHAMLRCTTSQANLKRKRDRRLSI